VSVGTLTPRVRRAPAGSRGEGARAALGSPAVLGVAGLTVLAAVLRFAYIGHQGFWFDEANTALLVHFSPGKMLGLIPQTESTPPLYYLVAWVWARVFGYGETGLRSLSALAGTLVVPVAYAAGAKLASRRVGLIAAALTACNPLLIWYSQEARSYELLVLLTSATLLAFLYARDDPNYRTLGAWLVVSVLALATHYYAVLAVVPQAAWLLSEHWRRRPVQIVIGIVGVCGIGLLQLALSQNANGRTSWIANAPLGRRFGQLVPQFVDGFPSPGQSVLEPIAIALVVLAVLLAVFRSEALRRRRVLGVGALALAGLIINLVLIAAGVDDLITRNVLALWLPAALLVAGGLGISRPAVAGLLVTVALCAIGVAGAVGIAADRNYQRPDWRGVAQVLGAGPARGAPARAILIQHYRDLLPLSLYMPQLKAAHRNSEAVSQLDIVSFTSPRSAGFCWWGSACNLWPSRAQASYAVPGFRELWRRKIYQFTVVRMVPDSGKPTAVSGTLVSPVLTTTHLRDDELLFQR
jgi:mannosyltransferase